jgi:2',3'-cyclic-nucleotide 2'-phosphodiesterase (5'-nucleotidase family)
VSRELLSVTRRGNLSLAALLAAAALASACPGSVPRALASWPARPESLLILHTNDIHAHLMPFEDPQGNVVGGASARAALIARLRGRPGTMLLLDAGDVFQGTPFYNYFRGVPDYRSMSLMRYDAGAFGNHELDDGPAHWLRASKEASFPILTANVFVAADSAWAAALAPASGAVRRSARWIGGRKVSESAGLRFLAKPYVIEVVGGMKVGILGLTTGDIVEIVDRSRNGGVAVTDPITAAAALMPEIRAKADFVIALTHLGVADDRALAARVPGIDMIVGGHSHTYLWQPIYVANHNANGYHGTAIMQAGRWGDRVGRLAIAVGPAGVRGLTDALVAVRPSEGEDRAVKALIRPYADSLAAAMNVPVFRTQSRVSMSGLEDGDTPLGNFVADAMLESGGGDIAIINSGGIRAPLPEGTVTVGDVFTVLPFDNTLVKVPMKGWQVRELFDFMARRIGKRGFAQISGASFVIRNGRASDVRVGGRTLESDRTYGVVTIDYLYTGGDGFTQFEKAGAAASTGILTHDAAIEFLRRHPGYEFKKRGRIRWEGGIPSRDLLSPR